MRRFQWWTFMHSPYLLIPLRGTRWDFGDAVQACTPATHVAIGILPITDDNAATIELADLIVGVAGELSSFGQLHGCSDSGRHVGGDSQSVTVLGCRIAVGSRVVLGAGDRSMIGG
jgi:hypothetical protein